MLASIRLGFRVISSFMSIIVYSISFITTIEIGINMNIIEIPGVRYILIFIIL